MKEPRPALFPDDGPGVYQVPTLRQKVRLVQSLLDRWLIVHPENESLAWSGSRWVPIGGDVQVSNFDTRAAAEGYATSLGFEVVG